MGNRNRSNAMPSDIYEPLRQRLVEATHGIELPWRRVTIRADGSVTIQHETGPDTVMVPPRDD